LFFTEKKQQENKAFQKIYKQQNENSLQQIDICFVYN